MSYGPTQAITREQHDRIVAATGRNYTDQFRAIGYQRTRGKGDSTGGDSK